MYDRIIVGYDATDPARDALALAGMLAQPGGAPLTVANVHELQPRWYGQERDYQRELRGRLDTTRAALVADVSGLPEGVEVESKFIGASSDARGLYELAEADKADLLVIGSTHQGPLGRVLVGTVGETLVGGAPCAIAVAPREYHRAPHRRIALVACGFDGSPESEVALQAAHAFARRKGAALRAIAVVEWRDHLRTRLEAAVRSLDRESVPLEEQILDGDPVEGLSEAGAEADVLVVGSRGYGPLRRAFVGSVSGKLIHGASVPLVVVARGAATGGEETFTVSDAVESVPATGARQER